MDEGGGDYSKTTSAMIPMYRAQYIEVLEFTHFVTMFEFNRDSESDGQKTMIDRIKVSVVLDLDCGNTNEEYIINKLPNEKNK